MKTFKNPILKGFYPDPSVCRVGDDFYMVTSTFSYYPGVPIFHSRDLVNWKQIGHVLDRPSQLNLTGLGHSQGIYAPTIRYHEGVFYMITTNVGYRGNFVVTATDPAGPWSDPYWLSSAPGIDPSLFFDEDGTAYYCGTRSVENEAYYGDNEIYLQEFDYETMSLVGPTHSLWRGALRDVVWPEAPHIYKRGDWYYLLIAEAGTCIHHAVTVARSREITGPYEGNRGNPILTHRHLGRDFPIVNVGHADLVETAQGEWWMVLLGSRPKGGYYRNLGRETFLVPVTWEDDWPIVSQGTGKVEWSYPVPELPEFEVEIEQALDDFDEKNLRLTWNFLRTPVDEFWSLTEREGFLRLKSKPEKIESKSTPAFVGRRQQHHNFVAQCAIEYDAKSEQDEAGLVALQNDDYYYRLVMTKSDGERVVRLVSVTDGEEEVLAEKPFSQERAILQISAEGQSYNFYFGDNEEELQELYLNADGRILSTDVAGGFVGTYLGMYCTSNGLPSTNYADFDWFKYEGL